MLIMTWILAILTCSISSADSAFSGSQVARAEVLLKELDTNYFRADPLITGSGDRQVVWWEDYESTHPWTWTETLPRSGSNLNSLFGSALSASGTRVLIGAPEDEQLGNASGAAYVIRENPVSGVWVNEAKLIADDGASGDQLGFDVALLGDLALVGARGKDDWAGAAYVFRRDPASGVWVEEAKLVASDGMTDDAFGSSVALQPDLALVGAPGADADKGAAYVFRYDPVQAAWLEEVRLAAIGGLDGDRFGSSLFLGPGRAVVGAPGADVAAVDAGSVLVFRFENSSGTWLGEGELHASDAEEGDHFGEALAMEDDLLLIGAPGADPLGSSSGAGYLFRGFRLPGSPPGSGSGSWASYYIIFDPPEPLHWREESKITGSDARPYDQYGRRVALAGRRILLGRQYGSLVFDLDPSTAAWSEAALLISDWRYGDILLHEDRAWLSGGEAVHLYESSSMSGQGQRIVSFRASENRGWTWGPRQAVTPNIRADQVLLEGETLHVVGEGEYWRLDRLGGAVWTHVSFTQEPIGAMSVVAEGKNVCVFFSRLRTTGSAVSLRAAWSRDGGLTFDASQEIGRDLSTRVEAVRGEVAYALVAKERDLRLETSVDGGPWTVVSVVPTGSSDPVARCELEVEDQVIHIVYAQYDYKYGNYIYYQRSLDSGTTWSPALEFGETYGDAYFSADGPYVAVALDSSIGSDAVVHASTDSGASFLPEHLISSGSARDCFVEGGRIVLSLVYQRDPAMIMSTNGGLSWSSPVKLNPLNPSGFRSLIGEPHFESAALGDVWTLGGDTVASPSLYVAGGRLPFVTATDNLDGTVTLRMRGADTTLPGSSARWALSSRPGWVGHPENPSLVLDLAPTALFEWSMSIAAQMSAPIRPDGSSEVVIPLTIPDAGWLLQGWENPSGHPGDGRQPGDVFQLDRL